MIKGKYDEKCNDSDLLKSINQIMAEKINPEMVRPFKTSKSRSSRSKKVGTSRAIAFRASNRK
jgi:hypothetical protein